MAGQPQRIRIVQAAPSHEAAERDRRLCRFMIAAPIALAIVVFASFRGYRSLFVGRHDAVIDKMTAYHRSSVKRGRVTSSVRADPVVDVVLVFKKPPRSGNPRDVKLRFSSVALERDAEVDWAYIAGHARHEDDTPIFSGALPTRRDRPASADADPPLGTPIEVTVSLPMKKEFEANRFDLLLTGTLDWGGVRQDTAKSSIGPFYEKKR